jgi:hypothetical protein
MITSQYAKPLGDVRVHAVDQGYTTTALNGHQGVQSVEEGAKAVVQACVTDELPAVFIDRHGAVPW